MAKVKILLCNGENKVIKLDNEKCLQLVEWFNNNTFPNKTIVILTKKSELTILTSSIIAIEVML